ncbi:hypothetical protein FACS189460_3150 [Deltaproteobacteria bacterium]|nr:hypothetical protein FACS189460_3150 [Deltaproteobacteria bacterium]
MKKMTGLLLLSLMLGGTSIAWASDQSGVAQVKAINKPAAAGGDRDLAQAVSNSIGMGFVLIPAGIFHMGANEFSPILSIAEKPRHQVTISRPFYLGKYEVTQEQWVAIMGSNPSMHKGKTNPVESVSWAEVQIFIQKLGEKEGLKGYRLPTEAEWEYAARAGTDTTWFFGDEPGQLGQYAWHWENTCESIYAQTKECWGPPRPVGGLAPNLWGLYDIYGNVGEWVQDWYGDKYYAASPDRDPQGPPLGDGQVIRGGSWRDLARSCRSAYRTYLVQCNLSARVPSDRDDDLGFRLVMATSPANPATPTPKAETQEGATSQMKTEAISPSLNNPSNLPSAPDDYERFFMDAGF